MRWQVRSDRRRGASGEGPPRRGRCAPARPPGPLGDGAEVEGRRAPASLGEVRGDEPRHLAHGQLPAGSGLAPRERRPRGRPPRGGPTARPTRRRSSARSRGEPVAGDAQGREQGGRRVDEAPLPVVAEDALAGLVRGEIALRRREELDREAGPRGGDAQAIDEEVEARGSGGARELDHHVLRAEGEVEEELEAHGAGAAPPCDEGAEATLEGLAARAAGDLFEEVAPDHLVAIRAGRSGTRRGCSGGSCPPRRAR